MFAAVVFAVVAVASGAARGQEAADSDAEELRLYQLEGFRSARFGTGLDEVRAAMRKDFDIASDAITETRHAEQKTLLLTVTVPVLEPGPGAARLSYIFGYESKKLIQVNISWGTTDEPAPGPEIVSAGLNLARYFGGYQWQEETVRRMIPLDDENVVLFFADALPGGSVEVRLQGVRVRRADNAEQLAEADEEAPVKQPPALFVSYILDRENPDIYVIREGDF